MKYYLLLGLRFLLGFLVGVSCFKLIAVIGLPSAMLITFMGSFLMSHIVTKVFDD